MLLLRCSLPEARKKTANTVPGCSHVTVSYPHGYFPFCVTPRSAANFKRSAKFVRQQRIVMPFVTYSPSTNSQHTRKILTNFTAGPSMANPLVKTVAATVRQFRKAKNMSQDDLAHVSGLDRTYISGVERGVRNITLESLEQIIKALEIPNSVFFKAVIEEDCSDLHVKQER